MKSTPLPPPEAVDSVLIWHQGALGDLLLAGPALVALRKHYPRARLIGLGHPERWGLLTRTLSLAGVWDSGESRWAPLFGDGPLPGELRDRLAPFQLALVFTPGSATPVPARLQQAGIPAVYWVPSFPEGGRESVAAVQAGHLAQFGLKVDADTFRLALPEPYCQDDFKRNGGRCPPYISGTESGLVAMSGKAAWLAVAPGSGQAAKNWPLGHYYEVSRALAWQYKLGVVWLAGPAEAAWTPYVQALAAAQGHVLLAGAPLARVAAALCRCRLFLGNDSGLTHLAAALGGPRVLALFGPTDPRVWAPPGEQVRVLSGPCLKAPCARSREITCPKSRCLEDLSPEQVLAAAGLLLSASTG